MTCMNGLLRIPIPQPYGDFPIIQYADDTLLLMQADPAQLICLRDLLHKFADSSGLRVNFSKSSIISINVPDTKMALLAATLGCQVGSLPFTYLGFPMGTTKPKFQDLTPIMDRIERRLSACSSLLSHSGRVQMVNSVISPTVTYVMCTIKLPLGFIDNIERAMKQCIWRGNLAAWPMVIKLKKKGGLGVKNLRLQNDALLMKQLHKFYGKAKVPWFRLIW